MVEIWLAGTFIVAGVSIIGLLFTTTLEDRRVTAWWFASFLASPAWIVTAPVAITYGILSGITLVAEELLGWTKPKWWKL